MEKFTSKMAHSNKHYDINQNEATQRGHMMRNNIDFNSNGRIQQQYLHKPFNAKSFVQSPNEQMDSVTREKILAQKQYAEKKKIP